MDKIKDENYILIQGWMITELSLKGNELLIYAIIYGFSQIENQSFNGSLQYLAEWTNSTKQSAIKCLKALIDKGYIGKNEKYINNVKFCEYYATKFNRVVNKVEQGSKQSLPNNIEYNIEYNNSNNNIYDFLQENGFILTPIHYEIISEWEDNDLTRYAIKQAVSNNKYNIKYIGSILNSYKRANIKTIQQAKEQEEQFNKHKNKTTYKEQNVPEWFNQDLNKEEEDKDYEEFLKNIGRSNKE